MKKRLLRLTIVSTLLIITLFIMVQSGMLRKNSESTAFAVGDLTIDWGIGTGNVGPIFTINNFAPGNSATHSAIVINGAPSARPVGVRGIETSGTGSLSAVLDIVISENGTDLYGGTTGAKTLDQFFTDSAGPDGILLSTVGPGNTTAYIFKVTFEESSGNEFQNTSVMFDLKIGISAPVPAACTDIDLVDGLPIFGTSGNDTINGTSGNDLIFGFEGNDRINGRGGNDCIVGNSGNDNLTGGNGDDFIDGNEGNDEIDGGNGKDTLNGGDNNDEISGGNQNDSIDAGNGNDDVNGGNSNDTIHLGSGNDTGNGGNDQDSVFGEDGNDILKGGNGKDMLDGGNDTDSANGGNAVDTCTAETKTNCEL